MASEESTQLAVDLLQQRAAELDGDVETARAEAFAAVDRLLRVVEEQEMLLEAASSLQGGSRAEWERHASLSARRPSKRLERMAEELRRLRLPPAGTAFSRRHPRRSHSAAAAGSYRAARDVLQSQDLASASRSMAPPPQSPMIIPPEPLLGLTEPAPAATGNVLRDAVLLVRDGAGRFRVSEVAEQVQRLDPARYSSARSAYGSVYDQLRRSSDYERIGPGEFRDPSADAAEEGADEEGEAMK